jgi:NADH-quinone oxidoreductase subunit J
MEQYLFYGLSTIAVFSAIMVIVSKKPIHSLLYLLLCFFTIAGHYVLLNAQFLAIVHIIVYAGAIMVLFLFTVMLLNLNIKGELQKPVIARIGAVIAGGLLLVALVGVLKGIDNNQALMNANNQVGQMKNISNALFNEYVLPFEVASILFLTAMVGAVMLGKDENKVVSK